MLGECIESWGFICWRAENALNGLYLLTQENPDLVLSDRELPDDTGELKVLRASKVARPERPVIVMSGRYSNEIVQTVLEAGADEFLPKPFVINQLYDLLQEHLKEPLSESAAGDVVHA